MLKLLYYLDLWLVLLVKPWRRQRGPRPIQPTAQLGQHYWGRKERGSPRGGDHTKKAGWRGGMEWGVEDKCTDRQTDSSGKSVSFKREVRRIWSFSWCKATHEKGDDMTDTTNKRDKQQGRGTQRWKWTKVEMENKAESRKDWKWAEWEKVQKEKK